MNDQPVRDGTLTRAELVDQVAEAADLTKKDADVVLQTVLGNIVEALRRGEKVELRGFGSFRLRRRGARRGRNSKTGDRVDVPPKLFPYFRPGKKLKALINQEQTEVLPPPLSEYAASNSHSASLANSVRPTRRRTCMYWKADPMRAGAWYHRG